MNDEQNSDAGEYREQFRFCKAQFEERKNGQVLLVANVRETAARERVEQALNRQLKDEVRGLAQELDEAQVRTRCGRSRGGAGRSAGGGCS